MTRSHWFAFSIGILCLILHLLPVVSLHAGFGTDALAYYSMPVAGAVIAVTLTMIIPRVAGALISGMLSFKLRAPSIPAWLCGAAAAVVFWFLKASTPLLGDGLDRIEALPAGIGAALRGQPAPLDIFIHWTLYRIIEIFSDKPDAARLSYVITACLAGGIYAGLNLRLSRNLFADSTSRILFFGGMISIGGVQLFAGYPENYSLLAAFIPLWIIMLFKYEKQKLHPGWMALTLVFLTGLHYFAFLLAPPTLYYFYRDKKRDQGKAFTALAVAACAAFAAFMVYMLQGHYRGVAAIFVKPEAWFSLSHINDYFQSQILASPAFVLLLGLAILLRGSRKDTAEKALFASSFLAAVFWFFLRPVIGAPFDWDLFAIPAFIYTPFLLIRIAQSSIEKTRLSYIAWLVVVLSLSHTIPWLGSNASEQKSLSRYERLLERETAQNAWAAGWGYYKLGKYLRLKGDPSRAFSAYDKALEANPRYSVLHEKTGLEMLALGRFDLGVTRLEEAKRINPTNPRIKQELISAKLLYAGSLMKNGDLRGAETQLLSILELEAMNVDAIKSLVYLYRYQTLEHSKAEKYERLLGDVKADEK